MFASEAQSRTWGSCGHLKPKYKPFSGKEGGRGPSVSHPFTAVGICWPQASSRRLVSLTLGTEAAAPSTAAGALGGAASLDMDPSWEVFSGQSVSSHCLGPLKHSTANAQPRRTRIKEGATIKK